MLTFKKTEDQKKAIGLFTKYKHIMLYGGSRSGKTFIIIFAIILRALKKKSRHVVLRHRFTHAITSIWYDTIPKVFQTCFPDVPYYENKSHWFIKLPNGSEIWVGGLDDKERTEKILGREYSSIFLNECSEMAYKSVLVVKTRLAEKSGLVNKMYYDCNPPLKTHWVYIVFEMGIDPTSGQTIDKNKYTSMMMHPHGNKNNLEEDFLKELENLPEEERQRFLEGKYGEISNRCIMKNWKIGGNIQNINDNYFIDGQYIKRIPSALDFGYSPEPAVMLNLFILEDHTLIWDELFYQTGLTAIQSKSSLPHSIQNKLHEINFDEKHIIVADSARNDSIAELRASGYNIFGSVKPRIIDGLNMLMSFNHIITEKSINVKHEFENYIRAVDKNGTILPDPIDKYNHAIDAAKYVVWLKGRLW